MKTIEEQIADMEAKKKALAKKQKELKKKQEQKILKENSKYLSWIDKETFVNIEKEIGKEIDVFVGKDESGKQNKEKKKITNDVVKKMIKRKLSYISFDRSDFE